MATLSRVKISVPKFSRNTVKAQTEQDVFFPVEEIDLVRVDGVKTNLRALVNGNNGDELGIVTDKYNVFTHRQASETVKEFLEKVSLPHVTTKLSTANSGSRFFEQIAFPSLAFDPAKGFVNSTALDNFGLTRDTYQPMITIKNSYDKTLGLSWSYGLFRIVCSNGMAVKVAEEKLSYKHNQILDVEAVQEHLVANLNKSSELMFTKYVELNQKQGTPILADFMASSINDRFKKMVLDKLGEKVQLVTEIEDTDKGQLWTIKEIATDVSAYALYNVLTEVNTHQIGNAGERATNDETIAQLVGMVA